MQVRPQRWTSLGGSILHDDDVPAYSTCKQNFVECIGYAGAQGSGAMQGDGREEGLDATTPKSNGSYEKRGAQSARSIPDQTLEPIATPSPILSQPMPALYRKAEMIFEGLDYCLCDSLMR